jgi:predicted KAP-like P-loop ATPase
MIVDYTKRRAIEKLEKFIDFLEEEESKIMANEAITGMQEKAILKYIQTDLSECNEIIRDLANE